MLHSMVPCCHNFSVLLTFVIIVVICFIEIVLLGFLYIIGWFWSRCKMSLKFYCEDFANFFFTIVYLNC